MGDIVGCEKRYNSVYDACAAPARAHRVHAQQALAVWATGPLARC